MKTYRRRRAAERYAVLNARILDQRHDIWELVIAIRNTWHRYQRSQVFDTVEHRVAFRASLVFALRRFAEEYERLLLTVAQELDRDPLTPPVRGATLARQMSVYVDGVRPRLVPPGVRNVLARYLDLRFCCPEDVADDQLRVLAVGLWGLWEQLEDGLREFSAWLGGMAE